MVFLVFLCKKYNPRRARSSLVPLIFIFASPAFYPYVTLRMLSGSLSWLKFGPLSVENEPRAAFA